MGTLEFANVLANATREALRGGQIEFLQSDSFVVGLDLVDFSPAEGGYVHVDAGVMLAALLCNLETPVTPPPVATFTSAAVWRKTPSFSPSVGINLPAVTLYAPMGRFEAYGLTVKKRIPPALLALLDED